MSNKSRLHISSAELEEIERLLHEFRNPVPRFSENLTGQGARFRDFYASLTLVPLGYIQSTASDHYHLVLNDLEAGESYAVIRAEVRHKTAPIILVHTWNPTEGIREAILNPPWEASKSEWRQIMVHIAREMGIYLRRLPDEDSSRTDRNTSYRREVAHKAQRLYNEGGGELTWDDVQERLGITETKRTLYRWIHEFPLEKSDA